MKSTTQKIFDELLIRYPALINQKNDILGAFEILQSTVIDKKTIFSCGNGGSAADSEHIVGELMKRFNKPREIDASVYNNLSEFGERGKRLQNVLEGTIKAISLTSHLSLSTAFSNDKEPAAVFAQQLYGLSDEGDSLICISTSGNSENCVLAAVTAKAKNVKVISLTGEKQSELSKISDVTIRVPEMRTYKIQELHLPIYHCLCLMLEEENF